jgi:hypothetical protein
LHSKFSSRIGSSAKPMKVHIWWTCKSKIYERSSILWGCRVTWHQLENQHGMNPTGNTEPIAPLQGKPTWANPTNNTTASLH